MYAAYGFGAKLPSSPLPASHCFALNGDIYKPFCNGTFGVLDAYYKARLNVQLFGPTYFSEILETVKGYAFNESIESSQFN
jgi:hypothetical protein